MEPWQERLTEEANELEDKIDKLEAFIKSEKFRTLIVDSQVLLKLQAEYMRLYFSVLIDRIKLI